MGNRAVYVATMISLASVAFGVVAALAWNAFITEAVKSVLPATAGLTGLLIYAVVVTVLAIVVIVWLAGMSAKSGGKSQI
ncbi:MAG: hypothetical protein AUH85_13100 [Chloroflexi bacterium 13_1_40CM_4_68_4]|nr:MAG: hypothetical protein AUH85_13100 [Chloroflexi bacterium 13_1_40CM_4_68_4]